MRRMARNPNYIKKKTIFLIYRAPAGWYRAQLARGDAMFFCSLLVLALMGGASLAWEPAHQAAAAPLAAVALAAAAGGARVHPRRAPRLPT
jgi:hypothetical protein